MEEDIVECIVTLPGQLFYSTQIPVCLWFVTKSKERHYRKGEILFIDARKKGFMADRTHKELSVEDIQDIASTFHAWRGTNDSLYEDILGFCKTATLEEVRKQDYILTPGRYVGLEEIEDDGIPFEEKMENMTVELAKFFVKSRYLEEEIRKNLGGVGYEF